MVNKRQDLRSKREKKMNTSNEKTMGTLITTYLTCPELRDTKTDDTNKLSPKWKDRRSDSNTENESVDNSTEQYIDTGRRRKEQTKKWDNDQFGHGTRPKR